MAWLTDKFPIDYLKQRIIYYKKKKSTVKNLNKDSFRLVDKYGGKEKLQEVINNRLVELDEISNEFKEAALILETVNRESLRHLVDVVWQHIYEDESVPATYVADELINKSLGLK